MALELLSARSQVLEVGCGAGGFLAKLLEIGANGVGIELNPTAVARARQRGCDVRETGILEYAEVNRDAFDMVACFQVLEHVQDPLRFLQSCVSALKPGGLLFISVPDGHGPLSILPEPMHPLDAPPHHQTRWNSSALQYICRLLPIDPVCIHLEPAQHAHHLAIIDAFIRGERETPIHWLSRAILRRIILQWSRHSGSIHRWRGHGIAAVFRRTTHPFALPAPR